MLKKSPDTPMSRSPEFSGTGPNVYRGIGGKPCDITANYLRLTVDENYGIFEYEVHFQPNIDSRDERYKAVNQVQYHLTVSRIIGKI